MVWGTHDDVKFGLWHSKTAINHAIRKYIIIVLRILQIKNLITPDNPQLSVLVFLVWLCQFGSTRFQHSGSWCIKPILVPDTKKGTIWHVWNFPYLIPDSGIFDGEKALWNTIWFCKILLEMMTIQQAWKLPHLILRADCYQSLVAVTGNKVAPWVLIETG